LRSAFDISPTTFAVSRFRSPNAIFASGFISVAVRSNLFYVDLVVAHRVG
jgi:hypothetical protein